MAEVNDTDSLFQWNDNGTHVCYIPNVTLSSDEWCGLKDSCTQKGLLLPLIQEVTWSKNFRAVLYLIGLLYSFLGVSIVADIFMCAIEKITSKTKQIHIAGSGEEGEEIIEVPVWNGTVANLTLMALGSSAPEILLSVIEILGAGFKAGKLGPGTIVGSAAFNLLGISAVCIAGVPKGETRRINQIIVFGVTASFSVFAYVWLLIILKAITPDRVDLWEAIVTFLFFPTLVVIAYAADKQWLNALFCRSMPKRSDGKQQIELGNFEPGEADGMVASQDQFHGGKMDKDALVSFIKDIKKNTKLSDEEAAIIAASKIVDSQPKSRMWYRIGATRNMTGGRKIQPTLKMNDRLKEGGTNNLLSPVSEDGVQKVYDAINENPEAPNIAFPDADEKKAIIEFHASSAAVMESIGTFKLLVCRHGKLSQQVRVRVETIDGSAVEGEDYQAVNEILTFEPNETEKEIGITIIDDNQWEPDEEFFVKLQLVQREDGDIVKLGRSSIMEITILNDDDPGTFQFEKRGHLVKESVGEAHLSVVRQNGADGDVEIKWRTIDKTAISGKDYQGGEGVLKFKHGETQRSISIPITDDMEFEKDENFEVELYEISVEGAQIGKISRTAVTITNDDEFNNVMNKMMLMTNANVDGMRVSSETWAQQFKDAMVVNGGDLENASVGDYVMHLLTFSFKLIFAVIPPAGLAGGWPCFFFSLGMIGLLTAIVGDLATIFGCLVGLKDEVTAITFVALGTSLPDTFASKAAVIGEKYADNGIGNITGSNSVNVFLGLGLPWLMAAIFWQIKNPCDATKTKNCGFEVKADTLGFSVALYSVLAVTAIIVFTLRRNLAFFGKAELGGTIGPKYASAAFMVLLWLIYVTFSTLQVYQIIEPGF